MRQSSVVTVPPAIEPLTLGEVKLWAKVDGTEEDALLSSLITAARESAENYLRRSLITQTIRLTLDLGCSRLYGDLGEGVYDLPQSALYGDLPTVIDLPRKPILAVSGIVTYDIDDTSASFSSSNYTLNTDSGRVSLTYGSTWPTNLRQIAACEITYTAGYGPTANSVPQAIRSAVLMHIQRMYDARIICEMPEECARLLRQYRVMDAPRHG